MAAIQSPGRILKLWNKVNDRYGPAEDEGKAKDSKKKKSEQEKAAEKQNDKVVKGLTQLRTIASGGVQAPSQVQRFERTRDKTVRIMKKYCKLLKSARSDTVQDMNKYRKSVKQLTVVVEELNPLSLQRDGEGDLDMSALAGIDTTALDKAMEDPNFGEYPEEELAEPEPEPEAGTQATTAPPQERAKKPVAPAQPTATGQVAVLKRLYALVGDYQAAIAQKGPQATQLQTLFGKVKGFVDSRAFEQACKVLDDMEPLIARARGAVTPAVDAEAKRFKTRLKALLPEVQKAQAAKIAQAPEVQRRITEANTLARQKDFRQANTALDEMEKLLKAPGEGGSPNVLAIWQQAGALVVKQLSQLRSKLRQANDPDLLKIADKGLKWVLKQIGNGLPGPLAAWEKAAGEARDKAKQTALALITNQKTFVKNHRLVPLLDKNPFGVPVTIGKTLGGALDRLDQMLSSS